MSALLWFGVLCVWANSATLQLLPTSTCGPCVQETCPPTTLPCDGLLELDDCNCCSKCIELSDVGLPSSSSEGYKQLSKEEDGDLVVHQGNSAAVQKEQGESGSPGLQHNSLSSLPAYSTYGMYSQNALITSYEYTTSLQNEPIAVTLIPYTVDENENIYTTSSPQTGETAYSKERDTDTNQNIEAIVPNDPKSTADALKKNIIKKTEQKPTVIFNLLNSLLNKLQQNWQTIADLGTISVNLLPIETESPLTVMGDTTEIAVTNSHFITVGTPSLLKDEITAEISRVKTDNELKMKRIGAAQIHQLLKDGSIILHMITNHTAQQVIHCVLSQTSIPGSYILADIVRTIVQAIHELTVYISESKFVVENPTWDSLKQIVVESIDKGFAKAYTLKPKIVGEAKEFILFDPTLIELGSDEKLRDKPTKVIETVENMKKYLESISMVAEEATNTVMQRRVKLGIMELAVSGSELFAQIADAIMNIVNAISKSILKSAFIKEKPSLQNLLQAVEHSIIVGVTESFKAVPEVIHATIKEIHRDDNLPSINRHNIELTTLEASKVRPIMNVYLELICDNFRHQKPTLWGKLAVSSLNIMPSILELFTEVDTHIMEILTDVKNIICTSKVLEEADSWNSLLQASNLVNYTIFERLASFQSKYHLYLIDLNQLLNHMGCSNTIQNTISYDDLTGDKSLIEITHIAFKHINNKLKMITDELIAINKNISIKLAALPVGNIINIISEIFIQVVNEMSRKMNESPFMTRPLTWSKFWFSVLESMTAGTVKATDIFVELIASTILHGQNETRSDSAETLRIDRSYKRSKRESSNNVRTQDIDKRNALKQNSLGSSYHNIPYHFPTAEVISKTSNSKFFVEDLNSRESANMAKAPEFMVTNLYLAMSPSSFPEKGATNQINGGKRVIELSMKRTGAVKILQQILKDGSIILQMLTYMAPQQVIYCALSQLSIPGSYILADIARTIMQGIHESVVYISQSKSVAENPSWNSLMQCITEAVEKGFTKASTSIPNILDGVKQFLSFNPTLIELGSDKNIKDKSTYAMKIILENAQMYLGSISKLLEEITSTQMRHKVKLEIEGSKLFAELTDAIMAITNAISKSTLESDFMKENLSLENLLEAVKNSIICGVTEGFKVAPKVIHIMMETMESDGFIKKDDTRNTEIPLVNGQNTKQIVTLEATKIRPIMNAYLQFICDNFRYPKTTLKQEKLATPSPSTMPSLLELFIELDTPIMETLTDVQNIICTSAVLKERDSWNSLLLAVNLVNNTVFERLASCQMKYHCNSTDLNQLLKHMGCNDTIRSTLSDRDSVGNKTFIEIVQIAFKYISNELKMKTDEMIDGCKKLNTKLAELPGGNTLNIILETVIQAVNEMSRKMSESVFIEEPPTWFNFWLSLIDVITGGAMKVADVFTELRTQDETSVRNAETTETDVSLKF